MITKMANQHKMHNTRQASSMYLNIQISTIQRNQIITGNNSFKLTPHPWPISQNKLHGQPKTSNPIHVQPVYTEHKLENVKLKVHSNSSMFTLFIITTKLLEVSYHTLQSKKWYTSTPSVKFSCQAHSSPLVSWVCISTHELFIPPHNLSFLFLCSQHRILHLPFSFLCP